MAKAITRAEYQEAREGYLGWCTGCEEFTRETTEPDAEGYDCPKCEGATVIGVENALCEGRFTFLENGHE